MSHTPTGLYVHIPFCKRKCLYCSFVVSIGQDARMDAYLDALEKEARLYRGASIDSVYIGGGTPSQLNPAQIIKLFEILKVNFKFDKNVETTFEINPDDADDERLTAIKSVGVNRVSLGIQSFNDKYLKFLGRVHNAEKAKASYDKIRKYFQNVSVDLMFCFPGQTLEEIRNDLNQTTALQSEHVSIYSLTVEEKSRFFVQKIKLPEDSTQAAHFSEVIRLLESDGLLQYEVSNFARKGLESKHNINYWRGGNYIGLGIGAHSHKDGLRRWNISSVFDYIKRSEGAETVILGEEILNNQQRFNELLVFGLRTKDGVDVNKIGELFNLQLSEVQKELIEDLESQEYFLRQGSVLKATKKGLHVLDEISARLME